MNSFSSNDKIICDLEHLLHSWSVDCDHKILIVDDNPNELYILQKNLQKYIVLTARNGLEALDLISSNPDISVIIADQNMPLMCGTELLEKVYSVNPYVVKILLTASADSEVIKKAINNCHLYRYILKPYDIKFLLESVEKGITKYELAVSKENIVDELSRLFYKSIVSIAITLDVKDQYTHMHSFRVALYTLVMAKALNLPDDIVIESEIAGLLHDIGKIAVPESILNKAGKLSNEEFAVIKRHTRQGFNLLKKIDKLKAVSNWILHHHESYNGSGYPDGLAMDQIPIVSRIISIADSYDAMTSNRSYRKAFSHEDAMAELIKNSGIQFDPMLVEVFKKFENDIKSIKKEPNVYCLNNSLLVNCVDLRQSTILNGI